MPELTIDTEVRALLSVATIDAENIRSGAALPALTAEIAQLGATLAAEYRGRAPSEIAGLAPARRLYRAFGIDPTSTRPSSEALVRRILQSKPFPSINAAVDLCNLCSVAFLLPIGLYDAGKISPPVVLRRGREGESYAGIRKDAVSLAGRPVLVDAVGPFGNPTSDSLRTSVDFETTSIWMVIFAPSDYPEAALISHESFAREAVSRHLRPPAAS
jgi:DNA/RNA-binding domain of Phe-tRNA-synthetase-like protein